MGGLFSSLPVPQVVPQVVPVPVPELPTDITKPYNCLIVSHNNRIQCLLKLLKSLYSNNPNDNPEEKIRFQNGAIIRLSLWKKKYSSQQPGNPEDYYGQLDLVYSGELSENEQRSRKPYYRVGENETTGKWRRFVTGEWNDLSGNGIASVKKSFHKIFGITTFLKLMSKLEENHYDGLVFYLMRHGRAWHNVEVKEQFPNKWGIQYHGGSRTQRGGWATLDTDLTPTGIRQAKLAGDFLNNYVMIDKKKHNYHPIQYIFVSDLMRAVQTAFFVCTKLNPPHSVTLVTPPSPDTYIVLPCSNESQSDGQDIGINNNNNSNNIICDNPSTALGKVGNIFRRAENFPGCSVVNGQIVNTCKIYNKMLYVDSIQKELVTVNLNWKYYLEFYKNQMRTGSNTSECNNTNMFEQAIKILLSNPQLSNPQLPSLQLPNPQLSSLQLSNLQLSSPQLPNISCKALSALTVKHPLYMNNAGIYIASYNMSWYSGSTLYSIPKAPSKSFASEYSWLRYLFNDRYGQWMSKVEFIPWEAGYANYTINSLIKINIETSSRLEPASVRRRCHFWLNALNNLCEFITQYKPGFIGLQEMNVNSDDTLKDNVKNISMNLQTNTATETNIIPTNDRVHDTVGTNGIWGELVKINKSLGTKYKLLNGIITNGIITNGQGLYIGISIIYDENQVGSLTSYKVVDNPNQFGRPLLMALTSKDYLLSSMHGAQPRTDASQLTDRNYFNNFNTYMTTCNQKFFQEEVKIFCDEKKVKPFEVYLATDLNDRYSTIEEINVIDKVIKYKGEAPITGAPNWDSSKGIPNEIKTETVNNIKCEISTYDGNINGKEPLTSAFVDVANELNRGDKLFCTDPLSPITIFESKHSLSNILDTEYVTEMRGKYGSNYNPMCRIASDHSLVFLKCGASFTPTGSKGGRRSRKNKKIRGRFTSHKRLTKKTRGKHLSKNINKKRSNKNK